MGDLRGAMQSQLATEFSNCLHMPDETAEQFINRMKWYLCLMVNDPGQAMKKSSRVFATNLLH